MWMLTAEFWREAIAFQTQGAVQKRSPSKAANCLLCPAGRNPYFARRAYLLYVSAHGPKRAKSVSPKVRKNGDLPAGPATAKAGNAALPVPS
jgi:hypothetical protein